MYRRVNVVNKEYRNMNTSWTHNVGQIVEVIRNVPFVFPLSTKGDESGRLHTEYPANLIVH
jgi:hypothetical protein